MGRNGTSILHRILTLILHENLAVLPTVCNTYNHMTDDTTQKKPLTTQEEDLEEHGVQDIIPKDEEYYTLDLTRDFDGDNNEDDLIDQNNEDGVEVGDAGHPGVDEDTG